MALAAEPIGTDWEVGQREPVPWDDKATRVLTREKNMVIAVELAKQANNVEAVSQAIAIARNEMYIANEAPTDFIEKKQFHNLSGHIQRETVPNFRHLAGLIETNNPGFLRPEMITLGELILYEHDVDQKVLGGDLQWRNPLTNRFESFPSSILQELQKNSREFLVSAQVTQGVNLSGTEQGLRKVEKRLIDKHRLNPDNMINLMKRLNEYMVKFKAELSQMATVQELTANRNRPETEQLSEEIIRERVEAIFASYSFDLRVMRVREVGNIEENSAQHLEQTMRKVGKFKTSEIEVGKAVIRSTIPDVEILSGGKGKVVYQPLQELVQNMIGRLKDLTPEELNGFKIMAELDRIADLATGALDPDLFLEAGTALWFEENVDATATLESVNYDLAKLETQLKNQYLQRLKDWGFFQVLFAQGQLRQAEDNVRFLPEPSRSEIKKVLEEGWQEAIRRAETMRDSWLSCDTLEELVGQNKTDSKLPYWPGWGKVQPAVIN